MEQTRPVVRIDAAPQSGVERARPAGRVQIPFVCPVCAGQNAIELLVLSRAGGVDCVKCAKWLKAPDVMRAIHSPRVADEGREVRLRAPPPAKPKMVWPPTPESRAAIAPLRKPRHEQN